MRFTDIFIRRPVLATVITLMILVLGGRAFLALPVNQYPHTENAVVTVTTTYYGADPDTVAGFISTPLENAIAQANGIDYITSNSQTSVSTITVYLRLNYDADKALTEISTKVSSVLNQLPPGSQQPVMNVQIGQTIDAMYIGFNSDVLPQNNITDYLVRVVQPRLQAVPGVQTAEIIGGQNFALRAWLDPQKLAAYNLTASDVSQALAQNDYISGLGNTKGQMVQVSLTASTGLHSLEEFRNLIVKQKNGAIIRLKDLGNVTLGADDYESRVSFDGKKAVYVGIKMAPTANLLSVIKDVRAVFADMQTEQPQGIYSRVVYDSTVFVNSSINEVLLTLIEAILIVTFVVFAFLGSPRAVLIPVIAIPLSLIGALFTMLMFGFSINLLTLLALVLGIGLVVDDAIIVVENVNRHLDDGMTPFDAAIQAAHELAGPIIAMTIVLIAVYIPLGFQGGLTGALFTEFAFTLVGAVTISAIIALTSSPMLCSRFLKPHSASDNPGWEKRITNFIDHTFEKVRVRYVNLLRHSLDYRPVTYVFAFIVLASIPVLIMTAKSELAPPEDQGYILVLQNPAPDATLQQRLMYAHQVYQTFKTYPEMDSVFQIEAPGNSLSGMVFKPWDQRDRSAGQIQQALSGDINKITGFRSAVINPPPLPGSQGYPVQFVIKTTKSFDELAAASWQFLAEAQKSGMFLFLDNDLKVDKPQADVEIDRDKAAELGLTMNDVGGALSAMLGGGYVNYFSLGGRSYKVIPQVDQPSRLNTDQLKQYYIRTSSGSSVPLSTLINIKTETVPESLNHFQQLNAATIQGAVFPGVAPGNALAYLQSLAAQTLPEGYSIDYGGEFRQIVQESGGFYMTLALAVIIIFLSLAAQFESFRDPLIILISVPMSIAGALIFISLGTGGASFNIYTKVGLITLIGLVSKHGILITEFANKIQYEGKSKLDAVVEATSIRLRPILMTTAAMVLGVIPLIFASGAGAASRYNMGLVIASGLSIGTLFTLFVVPAVYMLLAQDHHRKMGEPAPEESIDDNLAALPPPHD
jgi:multidrug efflux pump